MEVTLSSETILIAAVLVVVAAVTAALVAAALMFMRRSGEVSADALALLARQLESLRSELVAYLDHQSDRLDRAHETMGLHLHQASRTAAEVGQHLGRLEQATQQVLEVGHSVAQIESLLRAPKVRGVLGEVLLAELLRQALPDSLFELQFPLKEGERVDAVIRVGESFLPVDAKFPLDNLRRAQEATKDPERESHLRAFARDFRKHVDDVASKYVAPDRGTLPLALLYIPAESVYQAVLGDWSLAEYALARRVIPTGPLAFYAFLQVVLVGSRTVAVPRQWRGILAGLETLAVELAETRRELAKLGRHLDLARSTAEHLERRVSRLSGKIDATRGTLDASAPPESHRADEISSDK